MKDKKKKSRHGKKNNKTIIIIRVILLITLTLSVAYLLYYAHNSYKNKKLNNELYKEIETIEVPTGSSAYIEMVKEVQKENGDTVGWIKIENTEINYPILQTTNNDYYLTHNYKKEHSEYGSIFLDNNIDINNVNDNVIIYRTFYER